MKLHRLFVSFLLLFTNPVFSMADWWGDDIKAKRNAEIKRKADATEQLKKYAQRLTGHYPIVYQRAFVESFVKTLQDGADANTTIVTNDGFNQPVLIVALLSHLFYPPQIVKALLDAGANPNTKNHAGTPALSIAATKGLIETVQLLLEKNALIDLTDESGETALIFAINSKNDLNTQIYLIKLLTDNGANIDYTTPHNFTPLTTAIISPNVRPDNRIPLINLLLELGADPNKGSSPLILALSDKNSDRRTKLVQLLLQAGADPKLKYQGTTPLEYALNRRYAADPQDLDEWNKIIKWLENPAKAPRIAQKEKIISEKYRLIEPVLKEK